MAGAKVTRAILASQRVEVTAAPAFRGNRILAVRESLHLSQPVFAAALNVSPETVKKWEQGTRDPDGAALRLLELAEQHPEWILERLSSIRGTTTGRAAPIIEGRDERETITVPAQ